MRQLANQLFADQAGFVVSAELILVATVVVLSLVVGLNEISHGVNQELEDVGSAVGAIQQSYSFQGLTSLNKATTVGSIFDDQKDHCDSQFDIVGTDAVPEGRNRDYYHY